jgi:hypothetical protein
LKLGEPALLLLQGGDTERCPECFSPGTL